MQQMPLRQPFLSLFLVFLSCGLFAQSHQYVETANDSLDVVMSVQLDTALSYYVTAGIVGEVDSMAYINQFDECHTLVRAQEFGTEGDDDVFYRIRILDNGTVDNGYVAVGWTDQSGTDEAWIVVVDSELTLVASWLWTRGYGDRAYDVVVTNDGGFAVVGESTAADGDDDAFVIKFSSALTWSWTRLLGDADEDDAARAVIVNRDGNLAITGTTYINPMVGQQLLLAVLDPASGALIPIGPGLPYIGLGNTTDESGHALGHRGNDIYYFVGTRETDDDPLFMNFHPAGGLLNYKTYGGWGGDGRGVGVQWIPNLSRYIMAAEINQILSLNMACLMALDGNGDVVETWRYGASGHDAFYDMHTVRDGGRTRILVGGAKESGTVGYDTHNGCYVDTDARMIALCQRDTLSIGNDTDGGVVQAGTRYFPGPAPALYTPPQDSTDFESVPCIECNAKMAVQEPYVAPEDRLDVFPNPVRDRFHVRLTGRAEIAKWRLLDLRGGVLIEGGAQRHPQAVVVSVQGLAKGMYLLDLHTTTGEWIRKRILKE